MASWNTVQIYATSTAPSLHMPNIIKQSLALCGVSSAKIVKRCRPVSDWEEFFQHTLLRNPGWPAPNLEDTPHYIKMKSTPIDIVASLAIYPDTTMLVMMPSCPLQAKMGHELEVLKIIPDSIRGNACPNEIFFWFGHHDIIDYDLWADETKTRFICRTFFSMSFSGHGDPADHLEFRRLVHELPVIKETQAALGPIVGPTDILVSYNN